MCITNNLRTKIVKCLFLLHCTVTVECKGTLIGTAFARRVYLSSHFLLFCHLCIGRQSRRCGMHRTIWDTRSAYTTGCLRSRSRRRPWRIARNSRFYPRTQSSTFPRQPSNRSPRMQIQVGKFPSDCRTFDIRPNLHRAFGDRLPNFQEAEGAFSECCPLSPTVDEVRPLPRTWLRQLNCFETLSRHRIRAHAQRYGNAFRRKHKG